MGNRAVITASKSANVAESNDLGIYLHWNGGWDSVKGFLTYCKIKGYTSPERDENGYIQLARVIQNFMKSSTVEVAPCRALDCDNWDNGVYVIENWKIVGRQYFKGKEQHEYDLEEFVKYVDECQPEAERLGEDKIHILLDELKDEPQSLEDRIRRNIRNLDDDTISKIADIIRQITAN